MMKTLLPAMLFLLLATAASATKNPLPACWNQQVKPLQEQYLQCHYTETQTQFYHSFKPWEQMVFDAKGTIWMRGDAFYQQDSTRIRGRNKDYTLKTAYTKEMLLLQNAGETEPRQITQSELEEQILKTFRYSPMLLVQVLKEKGLKPNEESTREEAVYLTTIHLRQVRLYIGKKDQCVHKITVLEDDELYGDVLSSYEYADYTTGMKGLVYPQQIHIHKMNGKLQEEVILRDFTMTEKKPELLTRPANYAIQPDQPLLPELDLRTYHSSLYFLEMKHTDDRVLIVEFSEFFLVAEAPLNSANGELILSELNKIFPNKPVRYFVFGHHHPHYLGGIRPFVQRGAKIICRPEDTSYVNYIVKAPHRLNPDSLQRHPKDVMYDLVDSVKIIAEENFQMQIHHIGKRSDHTDDYLIYYFPTDKLLFVDDLMWIPFGEPLRKANSRQAGLYHAIKDLGLDVDTIVQSWPVSKYSVKTIESFEELERSVLMKE